MSSNYKIEVTLSKKRAGDLESVLLKGNQWRLSDIVTDAIAEQAGRSVVLTIKRRRDALDMLSAALNDVQMGGETLDGRAYGEIERAFNDAFLVRLKAN